MDLNDRNYELFASKCYLNTWASDEEFEEDLKRVRYVKKLITRYSNQNEIQVRLLLNHLICLYNCFGKEASLLILAKIDQKYWNILKPFFLFINIMPDTFVINETFHLNSMIGIDQNIVKELRGLECQSNN